jgi:hypothetical protein
MTHKIENGSKIKVNELMYNEISSPKEVFWYQTVTDKQGMMYTTSYKPSAKEIKEQIKIAEGFFKKLEEANEEFLKFDPRFNVSYVTRVFKYTPVSHFQVLLHNIKRKIYLIITGDNK